MITVKLVGPEIAEMTLPSREATERYLRAQMALGYVAVVVLETGEPWFLHGSTLPSDTREVWLLPTEEFLEWD